MSLEINDIKRQVVLDTETTGFNKNIGPNKTGCISDGHYIIEIAAIELINRTPNRKYHQYIKAPIPSSSESFAVHGITEEFLEDKPIFSEIANDLFNFLDGAELIIHNAPFDIAFLNKEFNRTDTFKDFVITNHCTIVDTLYEARKLFPGKKNNLDALCKRYNISISDRELHGAMIDTNLLLKVYLNMTGGQKSFIFPKDSQNKNNSTKINDNFVNDLKNKSLFITYATKEELDLHNELIEYINNINK